MAAKSKSTGKRGRPAKPAPSKAQVVAIAKMRRDGATWDEVIAESGYRTNSTGFRILLNKHGFDKFGRKDGKGTTKAKGYGSAKLNGSSKPAAKRRVKKTKATAKK